MQLDGNDRFSFEDSELDELEAVLQQRSAGRRGEGVLRRSRRSPRGRGGPGSVGARRLFEEVVGGYNEWVSNPGQELLLGAFALLAGNYLAHFLDTTFGQAGFWETVVGAVTTFFIEWISRQYAAARAAPPHAPRRRTRRTTARITPPHAPHRSTRRRTRARPTRRAAARAPTTWLRLPASAAPRGTAAEPLSCRAPRRYYIVPARERTSTLKMLNALKTGLFFGLVLDALKLAG